MSKTKVRFMATSINEDVDCLDGLDGHGSNANTYRLSKQHMGRKLRQRNIPYKYEMTSEQGLEGLDTSYPFTTRAYAERNLLDCATFHRRVQNQYSSPSNRRYSWPHSLRSEIERRGSRLFSNRLLYPKLNRTVSFVAVKMVQLQVLGMKKGSYEHVGLSKIALKMLSDAARESHQG